MAIRAAGYIWMMFFISLTGCLFGICVELYVNGLTRPFSNAKTTILPDISILHTWATGMLLQYVVVQIMELQRGANRPLDWENMPFTAASGFYAIMEVSLNCRFLEVKWNYTDYV